MSLEGTLETIALPDVLALLSVTAKTGELRIEAGGGVGSVWLDAGQLAGYDVGNHRTPVDALFALLRLSEGNFKFHTGTNVVNVVAPQEVAPVLEEAENRLTQWPGIAGVVPSLHCELKLQESVEGTVMLRPDQWQLVASIGGGRHVTDVLNLRSLGEFDGCKAVKELVDLHLVKVTEGEAPQPPEASLTPAADRAEYRPSHLSEANVVALSSAEWHEEDAEVAGEAEVSAWADIPVPVGAQVAVAAEVTVAAQMTGPQMAVAAEVADLSQVWNDETGEAEVRAVEVAEPAEPAQPAQPAPEPVNRGLLLKFLGSARN